MCTLILRNGIKIKDGYLLCGYNLNGGWVISLAEDGSKVWDATNTYLDGVKYGCFYPLYYISGIDTLPNGRGFQEIHLTVRLHSSRA